MDYEELQLQREFYSPVYASNSDRQKQIPDLTSTLYWKPEVSNDTAENGTLQFYTFDQQGKF